VADLSDYWTDHPPLQVMVQSYLGIKPRNAAAPVDTTMLEALPGTYYGPAPAWLTQSPEKPDANG